MSIKNVMGGIVAGAAIGAIGVAVGVLIAPASGDKTRKKMEKQSRKFIDQLRSTVTGSVESVKDKYNNGVDEVAARGTESINSAREKVKV